MKPGDIEQPVVLTVAEAADLATRAARQGVSTPDFLGYHVRRSAYGALHPRVVEFEQRPDLGREGTEDERG
jgi:hypothetical protein